EREARTYRRGYLSPAWGRPGNCRTTTWWRQDASYSPTWQSWRRPDHSSEMSGQTWDALTFIPSRNVREFAPFRSPNAALARENPPEVVRPAFPIPESV